MKKKILSALLSAAMVASAMPMSVSMAQGAKPWVMFEEGFDAAFDVASSPYRIVNAKEILPEKDSDGNIFGYWDVNGGDMFMPTQADGVINVGYCGNRKPMLLLKNELPIEGNDIIIETRVKFTAQNNFVLEDGIAIGDGSNPLLNFLDTTADNYTLGARISQPGNNSTYISGGGNGTNVVSNMKPQNNEWVNFSVKISGDGQKFSYTASKDNGEIYTSPALTPQRELSNIKYVQLGYGGFTGTAIDYVRIYDTSKLGNVEIISGVNDEPIDGQNGVPTDCEVTMIFDNPITVEELGEISVSNNADFEIEAIDETFAVLKFKGLKNAATYTIHIPMIGGNKVTDATFTTAAPEGALFSESFDSVNSNYRIVNTKSLLPARDEDGNIFGDFVDYSLMGGVLDIPYCGNRKPTVMFKDAVKTGEELVIETKVKYKAVGSAKKNEDGTIFITNGNNPLFNIMGSTSDNFTKGIIMSQDADGNIAAGNDGDQEASNIKIKEDIWYTFSIILNADGKKFRYTVSDENGNSYNSGELNVYTAFAPLADVRYIQFPYGDFSYTKVDYINVLNVGSVDVVNAESGEGLDGAIDVATNFDATVFFTNRVTEDDLAKITVSNNANFTVTANDDYSATISFTELENAASYTIHIPMIGGNAPKDVTFVTQAPQWMLFNDDFDAATGLYRMVDAKSLLNSEDSDGNIFGDYVAATVSDGKLNVPFGGNVKPTMMLKKSIPLSAGKDLLINTRVQYKSHNNFKDEDGTIHISDNNNPLFNIMGAGANNYTKGIVITTDATGTIMAGNGGDQVSTGIVLKDQTWYNISIKLDGTGRTFTLTVSDDNGNSFESDNLNTASALTSLRYVQLAYGGFTGTTLDFFNIMDASLIPVPQATFGKFNDELDGAGNVRPGDTVTISAKSELNAETIVLDGVKIAVDMSADSKTATFTVPSLEPRTKHTLAVDGTSFEFRAADEPKYMYRAEFDGNDDDSVWYLSLNANKYSIENTSNCVKDGIFTYECAGDYMYRAFMPIFAQTDNETFITKTPKPSQKLDCTGKKNVIIDTKFMLGEGTVDRQFMYIGNNMALLAVDENRVLHYNGDPGKLGDPFTVYDDEFVLEPNRWYSVSIQIDFVSQKYQVSVDDGNGNIANSGVLNFIYNHQKFEITDFRFARMLNNTDAPLSIDYLRITDGDYGKVDVTYGDGIALDGAALVEDSDVFTFTSINAPQNLYDIELIDENDNKLVIEVEAEGNNVTIFPMGLEYNTKYSLLIPATVTGADEDQKVAFRTIYDKSATFAYPAGYTAQDELNVVYFGGSITAQEGWRVYSTNWITDKFPNAHCYNASIGGTGAEYGWTRLNRDVISKNPDIVFVEYAVNDSANPTTAKYMESIVRNLNALPKPPVIIFVYTTVLNFGTNTYAMAEHERVAKAYGIPTISIHDYVQSLYNTDPQFAKDWDAKKYLPDSTHPSTSGDTNCAKVYGEYVNALMTANCDKYLVKPEKNSAVSPLTEYKNFVYDYDNVDITLENAGDKYEFEFKGDELLVDFARNNQGGRLMIEVDGKVVVASAETYVQSGPPMFVRAAGLGEGTHSAVITVLNDAQTSSHRVKINTILTKPEKDGGLTFGNIEFNAPNLTTNVPLKATVNYTGSGSEPVTMAIALYDNKGVFTGMTTVTTTTDSVSENKSISVVVTPKPGDVKAKAFLWNSLSEMKPLADAVSVAE